MAIDYTKCLSPIRCNGFSCSCCGKLLQPADLIVSCADCGVIFCEECVRNGEVNNHECEDDYFGDGDEAD